MKQCTEQIEGRVFLKRKKVMVSTSGRKGRRTNGVLVTYGRTSMIDELDATIDVIVWFLELKLILAGNSTIYGNSQSTSG